VKSEELALVQGWAATERTLGGYRGTRFRVLVPWTLGSLATACLLLTAAYFVSLSQTPDASGVPFAGVTRQRYFFDYPYVLFRNYMVLAFHALACVAGFIAGSSMPTVAQGYKGIMRKVHEYAGPAAIVFVIGATMFSLVTQAYVAGGHVATLSNQLGVSRFECVLLLTPHAIPELTALFLPLAAWTMASRKRAWDELLAATLITVAVAVPVIIVAGAVEIYVTPLIMNAVT
jgi:hypothetical protein